MHLVVVGGLAAGLSAASRARRVDRSLDITVLEKGPTISYGACGLPYYIEGQVRSIGELTVYTPEFFERERDIRIRTNSEVAAIRHAQRELVLSSGDRVRYDKLIWAAGARPERRVEGAMVLQTDRDAMVLDTFLRERKPRTAAVIGGGYIGLEMATSLRARGLTVTVYDCNSDLLGREDAGLTKVLLERLERCRVAVALGQQVRSREQVKADLVLEAAGLRPNVEVPAEAGVQLGRSGAIAASEYLETSLNGIYAAGDCAEALHRVTGRPVWIPLGTTANKMGYAAGSNAAGRRERFHGVVGTSIVRVGGLGVGMTGLSEAQARREGFSPMSATIEDYDRPRYFRGRKVRVTLTGDRSSGRLLGGTVTGDEGVPGRVNTIATALTAGMTVEDFAQLDLAYAPPFATVMDPLLIAARQLARLLH